MSVWTHGPYEGDDKWVYDPGVKLLESGRVANACGLYFITFGQVHNMELCKRALISTLMKTPARLVLLYLTPDQVAQAGELVTDLGFEKVMELPRQYTTGNMTMYLRKAEHSGLKRTNLF